MESIAASALASSLPREGRGTWTGLQPASPPPLQEESLEMVGVWTQGLVAFKHHELFRRSSETGCSPPTATAGDTLHCGAGTRLCNEGSKQ